MGRQIFVNLPVRDLSKSVAFFQALGFQFDPRFTSDQSACMVITEGSIYAMFLSHEYFQTFTSKHITDATTSTEVLIALSCETRHEVDDLVAKAVAAGGAIARAVNDHGFMYDHAFTDLDGHTWELAYMDMSGMPSESEPS